jgi:hypothetical protein
METFTSPKEAVTNPYFDQSRKAALQSLNYSLLDLPLIDIVTLFNNLPFTYTLQCCYGHFLYSLQKDEHNLQPLPDYDPGIITYRIAYIAFCIRKDSEGIQFRDSLMKLQYIDPGLIQFGSSDWFWEKWLNSYVLQVEPEKYKYFDKAECTWKEALHIEEIRNLIFKELVVILHNFLK